MPKYTHLFQNFIIKQKFIAYLIIIIINTFSIIFIAQPVSGQTISARSGILEVLDSMGYRDATIEGCVLEFHRDIDPTPENNYFASYYRRINLSNVNISEISDVESVLSDDRTRVYYKIIAPSTSEYMNKFRQVYFFWQWVRENYPSVKMPYGHPIFHDGLAPIIEMETRRRIKDISGMNVWVNIAEYGPVTEFEPSFVLTFDKKDVLQNFKELLLQYSKESRC